ncbi:type II secretion system protein [Actinoplanes sp. LDG1-06]|uniref:Type II secretion system protein n=1 Tax=Paractinoplanes ovalisporus TaxID=2810368 RepID=A0ABS2AGI0_9ACTN|nr:type II secretion system protein [Actinoplanes ovalisporus]MBM2618926.1 type II secretion system protein [Actinoplanes ovalisporus]
MTRRVYKDDGFTLLETMVALAIVGTVMAALSLFFIRTSTVQHRQADTQVAAQIAANSLDFVSQLPGENVLLGRTQAAVQSQWQAPGTSVYLDSTRTDLTQAFDTTSPASTLQGLPTAPETIQLTDDTPAYQRWWYVGRCWQAKTGGDCTVVSTLLRPTRIEMFRIVVAITWTAPDCANRQCSYVTTMLAESSLDDPIW